MQHMSRLQHQKALAVQCRPSSWQPWLARPHLCCQRHRHVIRLAAAAAAPPLDPRIAELVGDLPIREVLPDVLEALRQQPCAVLQAPPGAGKTTTVPLAMLLQEPPYLQQQQKILVLEPRRVAAKVAARRMAALLGQPVGGTVGYRVRLETRVSRTTRVEVVTEGLFLRRLQQDPSLEGVGAVLLDEFHERNLDSDTALTLLMDARSWARPDLRVLVMSATLGGGLAEDVAALMVDPTPAETTAAAAGAPASGEAAAAAVAGVPPVPVLVSEGRSYPVRTVYLGEPMTRGRGELERAVAAAVKTSLEHPGDVLVFLPGVGEIRRTAGLLSEESQLRGVQLLPLHGNLSAQQQDKAIRPDPAGRRRVILSTPIAESSLTIQGVRIVVDSGYCRAPVYDPDTGISRLRTQFISTASADQRRGRAGRTAPGVCFRLWDADKALQDRTDPEIWGADLAPLALEVAAWGSPGGAGLRWLDAPDAEDMEEAGELLVELGATTEQGSVTATGRQMVGLGVHPRFAHLVLRSQQLGVAELGCLLANLLSERDLLRAAPPAAAGANGSSSSSSSRPGADLASRIAVLAGSVPPPAGWDHAAAERVVKGAQQMLRQLANTAAAAAAAAAEASDQDLTPPSESSVEEDEAEEVDEVGRQSVSDSDSSSSSREAGSSASQNSRPRQQQQQQQQLQQAWQEQAKKLGLVGALVALAYPDRIAQRKASGSSSSSSRAQFQLSSGATTKLWDTKDPLGEAEYIAIAELSQGKAGDNDVIRLGAALTRRAIQSYLQQEIQDRTNVFWAPGSSTIVGKVQKRLGALVLEEKPLPSLSDQQAWPIWNKVLQQNGFAWLPIPPAAAAWQQRAAWLRDAQLQRSGSSSLPDLTPAGLMAKVGVWLAPHLAGVRSKAQLAKLDWLGIFKGMMTWEQQQQVEREAPPQLLLPTGTRAAISYSGAQPTARARMQEVFGLEDTPRLGGAAAVPLLLELLSPASRPLQVTSDLANFWATSYTAVKKEMKGRYPRHYWPDNPLEAEPTKLTKKAMDRQAAAAGAGGDAGGATSTSSGGGSSSSKRSGGAKKKR